MEVKRARMKTTALTTEATIGLTIWLGKDWLIKEEEWMDTMMEWRNDRDEQYNRPWVVYSATITKLQLSRCIIDHCSQNELCWSMIEANLCKSRSEVWNDDAMVGWLKYLSYKAKSARWNLPCSSFEDEHLQRWFPLSIRHTFRSSEDILSNLDVLFRALLSSVGKLSPIVNHICIQSCFQLWIPLNSLDSPLTLSISRHTMRSPLFLLLLLVRSFSSGHQEFVHLSDANFTGRFVHWRAVFTRWGNPASWP